MSSLFKYLNIPSKKWSQPYCGLELHLVLCDLTLNDKLSCTHKLRTGIGLGLEAEKILPITFCLMKDM